MGGLRRPRSRPSPTPGHLFSAGSGGLGPDFKAHPFRWLQIRNDCEQVAGGRVSVGAQHLVQGLDVKLGVLGQLRESNGGIDVVAQELFAERYLAGEEALDSFREESFAKGGIFLDAGLNGFP